MGGWRVLRSFTGFTLAGWINLCSCGPPPRDDGDDDDAAGACLVRSFVSSESWDLYSAGTVQFSGCSTSNLDFIWRKTFFPLPLRPQWEIKR